jgi:LysR family glycine cleavage system transcriptional activator
MHDLPPLRALRAFDLCYRLRSFTGAAKRLNVGQPAISHQIRLLERDLEVTLFEKRGSQIRATPEADAYFEEIAPALARIADASRRRRAAARTGPPGISLGTYPGIAAHWVLPRIAEMGGGMATLRTVTAERDSDIDLDRVDLAILFGRGPWPGRAGVPLASERIVPVAAASLAAIWRRADPGEIVARGPLIHLEDAEHRWFDWNDWRDRFAPDVETVARRNTVTNHALSLNEAIQGRGIALAWLGVVDDLIASGVLAPVFDTPLTSDRAYWLIAGGGGEETEVFKDLAARLTVPLSP